MVPPSGQQTSFTQPMQLVPGYNQLGGVVPASGSQFGPPTGGQFNVANGGVWASQSGGQLTTWTQPTASPAAAAAANPFIVSLSRQSIYMSHA